MLFNALALSATLFASIGAPAPQAPAAPGSLKFTAPKGWETRAPSSAMRVGEFAVPGVNGSAELVVYYFGGTGGSVDANIQRWLGQMQQPDGKPTSEVAKRETKTINGLDVSLLDVSGTYCFVRASQTGRLDVSVVLSSLYPVITVVLARLILKERLTPLKATGMAAAIVAMPLIVLK